MVILAKHSGFCAGVKRAVDKVVEIGADGVYTLGDIIHNESVVNKLKELGVKKIDNVYDIDSGKVVIRSHGAPKSVFEYLKTKKDIEVIDCTCPFVKKIHQIVEEYSKKGYQIIIVGEKDHPEVVGISGWCDNKAIVTQEFDESFDYNQFEKVCIVAQTTCSIAKFNDFLDNFAKSYQKTVEIFRTICYTTYERQIEAENLSKNCDCMIVIGGEKSSNTRKLYDICKANCDCVVLINNSNQFDAKKYVNYKKVGIVSGASTPPEQSMEVFSKMEEVSTQAVSVNTMEEAMAEMDGKASKFHKNQIINATISQANDDGLAVYISGTKKEILLSKEELDCEAYDKADYQSKVGNEIKLMVITVNPLTLSEKSIRLFAEEQKEIEEIKNGKVFEVKIDGANKGGLTAKYGSFEVFIPASQIRIGFVKDLDKFIGKSFTVKAERIEDEKRRKQIVASRRVILEAEKAEKDAIKAEKENEFFANVGVGDIVVGKVVRFASFGAFVEVNGFDCLAHISDLSWTNIKSANEVLEIGKEYQFKVLKADQETKHVSIGYKQLQQRPWDAIPGKYGVGDVITGKVVRITSFGAFVEIEKGVDGLVHVSQISNEWLENPTSTLKEGQEVTAKITTIDYDKERISLSIKACQPAPQVEGKKEVEGEEKPKKRTKREPKAQDDGEVHGWTDGGFAGVSISELTNLDK